MWTILLRRATPAVRGHVSAVRLQRQQWQLWRRDWTVFELYQLHVRHALRVLFWRLVRLRCSSQLYLYVVRFYSSSLDAVISSSFNGQYFTTTRVSPSQSVNPFRILVEHEVLEAVVVQIGTLKTCSNIGQLQKSVLVFSVGRSITLILLRWRAPALCT